MEEEKWLVVLTIAEIIRIITGMMMMSKLEIQFPKKNSLMNVNLELDY
jgi:hypothetical protein